MTHYSETWLLWRWQKRSMGTRPRLGVSGEMPSRTQRGRPYTYSYIEALTCSIFHGKYIDKSGSLVPLIFNLGISNRPGVVPLQGLRTTDPGGVWCQKIQRSALPFVRPSPAQHNRHAKTMDSIPYWQCLKQVGKAAGRRACAKKASLQS